MRESRRGVQARGLGEVIADGVTGFLAPPGDIQAAVKAVGRMAGTPRSACRDHAEGHLDLERSLDAHERLYRRLLRATDVTDPAAGAVSTEDRADKW